MQLVLKQKLAEALKQFNRDATEQLIFINSVHISVSADLFFLRLSILLTYRNSTPDWDGNNFAKPSLHKYVPIFLPLITLSKNAFHSIQTRMQIVRFTLREQAKIHSMSRTVFPLGVTAMWVANVSYTGFSRPLRSTDLRPTDLRRKHTFDILHLRGKKCIFKISWHKL